MTRDQARFYLKSSGFSDLQIGEIESAFIVNFVFNSSIGAKCVEKKMEEVEKNDNKRKENAG